MPKGEQFGSWTLAAAAATLFLAIPLQPVVGYMALRAGDTAAWMIPPLAGLLVLALYLPAAVSLAAHPRGNLIDLARAAAGEPASVVTGGLVTALLVFDSGLVMRRVAESAVSHLYPHTPQTFAVVAIATCVLYGAYGGANDLVRLCRLLLPLFMLAIFVILLGPLPWSGLHNLLPFWGSGAGSLARGAAQLAGLYSPSVLFLLVAAGQLSDRHRLWRAGLVATCGATLLFSVLLGVILLVYPLPLGYSMTFPFQELTRLVTGGRFFERIESVWIVFEFFATACYLAVELHTAAAAYAGAFRMATHRTVLLPLITMALTISLVPRDQGEAITLRAASMGFSVAIGFGLPLLLALLAAWRRRSHGLGR